MSVKVNIKITPGFLEALARLDEASRLALHRAAKDAAEQIDREFMSEHFDLQCARYHATDGSSLL